MQCEGGGGEVVAIVLSLQWPCFNLEETCIRHTSSLFV